MWSLKKRMEIAGSSLLNSNKLILDTKTDMGRPELLVCDKIKSDEDLEFFSILQKGKFSCKDLNKDYLHVDSGRTTFLCKACEIGSLTLVKWLIHNGADIDRQDMEVGNSPLIWSLISNHKEISKYLIKRGADRYIKNNEGRDAFYYAFQDNNLEIPELVNAKERTMQCIEKTPIKFIRRLTTHKSIRKNTVIFGDTPVHESVRRGNIDVLKKLVLNGYDINDINDFKETPLHVAMTKKNLAAVKLLVKKKAMLNKQDIDGNTPFHILMTIYSSDVIDDKIVKFLMKSKVDPDITNRIGDSPLDVAFKNDHTKLIKTLLKCVKGTDDVCLKLLFLAIKNNHKDIVDWMFRKFECLKNRTDEFGNSALHYAIEFENYEMVRIICEYADINIQNENGYSPLHLAVEKKQNEIVGLLLSSKANVDLQNNAGETAIHLAVTSNMLIFILLVDWAQVSLLTSRNESALHRIVSNGDSSYISMVMNSKTATNFIDKTPFVDVQDTDGNTALHYACAIDNFEAVLKLLDFNANQYLVNGKRQTCLDIATENGFSNIKRLLLEDQGNFERALDYESCQSCDRTLSNTQLAYQCVKGHRFCEICKSKLEGCPSCDGSEIFCLQNPCGRGGIADFCREDSFEALFVLN